MLKRVIGTLIFTIAATLGVNGAAFAQVGRCVDQVRGVAFDVFGDGMIIQVGNPANYGMGARDPSGQTFMRMPSTAPQLTAFFVGWDLSLIQIHRFQGVQVIGGCQFVPGFMPPPPYINLYQPPVMHPQLAVETPAGFMPVPQTLVDPERPFSKPMITDESRAQTCYQNAWSQSGLNRQQFGDCMVKAMAGDREAAAYQCARSHDTADARAFCMIGILGGQRERQLATALQQCHTTYGADYSRYPLCMSSYTADGDAGRLLACVEQQSRQGDVTVMGTAMCYGAQQLDLNPEMQIVVQCAVATGGEPYSFTSCAGGQLAARELDKCLTGGVGGPQGCFGPNNDLIKGLTEIGNVIGAQFGPGNDLVQAWNTAVNDLTQGPGPNNDAVRVIQNIGNEVGRAPGNIAKAVERAMPRIKIKF